MLRKVVLIGSGNLAEALAAALVASGAELLQIYGRNAARVALLAARAGAAACTDPAALERTADLYLIAVFHRRPRRWIRADDPSFVDVIRSFFHICDFKIMISEIRSHVIF